jgi:hypothetical protein
MHRVTPLSRRRFMSAVSLAAAGPLLARCLPHSTTDAGVDGGDGGTNAGSDGGTTIVPPQRLETTVTQAADGTFRRTFSGIAAPQDLEFFDEEAGVRRHLYEAYPRDNCRFFIDTRRKLGADGYALEVIDRTLGGIIPTSADPIWALNMIPFGLAIDGAIIDPSGPWYDGGAADPNNPFDRNCTGWEYDPVFPAVRKLVGVPAEIRGHVQPGAGGRPGSAGQFHYHGYPATMLANLRRALTDEERRHPLIAGYSADGYWILDAVIPAESTPSGKRRHHFSGYVLRDGTRAALPHTNPAFVPPGTYDGLYVQDWRYDADKKRALIEASLRDAGSYLGLTAEDVSSGRAEYAVLDERNGLVIDGLNVPGAPAHAYAYVATQDWPEFPHWLSFEPSESFRTNIIPFQRPDGGMGPPGRIQLYDACSADLLDVHQWNGRPPY